MNRSLAQLLFVHRAATGIPDIISETVVAEHYHHICSQQLGDNRARHFATQFMPYIYCVYTIASLLSGAGKKGKVKATPVTGHEGP